jgi:hypothetical protein
MAKQTNKKGLSHTGEVAFTAAPSHIELCRARKGHSKAPPYLICFFYFGSAVPCAATKLSSPGHAQTELLFEAKTAPDQQHHPLARSRRRQP